MIAIECMDPSDISKALNPRDPKLPVTCTCVHTVAGGTTSWVVQGGAARHMGP